LAQARLEGIPVPLLPTQPERSAPRSPGSLSRSMLHVVAFIIVLPLLQALDEPGDELLSTWDLEDLPPIPRHHRPASALATESVDLQEPLGDELDDVPRASPSSLSNSSSLPSAVVGTTVPPGHGSSGLLIGRYPGVQRALQSMPGPTKELRDIQQRMQDEQKRLQVEAGTTLTHMEEALKLKRAMRQEEARVQNDKQKAQELRSSLMEMDEIHSKLEEKVKYVMSRKIHAAEGRIKRHRVEFAKAQQLVMARGQNEESIKEKAQLLVQQKNRALDSLRSADDAVKQAKEKLQESEISFRTARMTASRGVEAYKHAIAKKAAALSVAQRVEEHVNADEASMTKLVSIRDAQERSIDKITAVKKKRLQRNVDRFEADEMAMERDLVVNRKKYESLEADEHRFRQHMNWMKADVSASTDALTKRQRDILHSAETNEGKRAEAVDEYSYRGWPDASFDGNDADGFAF